MHCCPYRDFDEMAWLDSLRACGFSYKDLRRLPSKFMQWLFALYHLTENGVAWPDRLSLARVTMLAKPDSPCATDYGYECFVSSMEQVS